MKVNSSDLDLFDRALMSKTINKGCSDS